MTISKQQSNKQEADIEVTGIDLVAAVKAAYDLSIPVGLGWLHAEPGSLTDDQAESLLQPTSSRRAFYLDYVKGRCCKFGIDRDAEGRLWIGPRWFDHTQDQLRELLRIAGNPDAAAKVPA